MTLSTSRLKELQERWERKRRERAHVRGYIVAVPADMADMSTLYRGLERPPGLRGTDFVQELARLALEWGDRRFAQCARALLELGIVDKQGFTKKRGPHATSLIESAKAYAVAKVWALIKDRSLSEREACAVVAEDLVGKLPASRRRSSSCDKLHVKHAGWGKRARG